MPLSYYIPNSNDLHFYNFLVIFSIENRKSASTIENKKKPEKSASAADFSGFFLLFYRKQHECAVSKRFVIDTDLKLA